MNKQLFDWIDHTGLLKGFEELVESTSGFSNVSGYWASNKEGNSVFYVDVPGIKKEDLNVRLDDRYLLISGKTGNRSANHKVYWGSQQPEKLEAKLENGVLSVIFHVKKKENKELLKVEVQ
jgi:HSP20 family molecular chaperone IbpA